MCIWIVCMKATAAATPTKTTTTTTIAFTIITFESEKNAILLTRVVYLLFCLCLSLVLIWFVYFSAELESPLYTVSYLLYVNKVNIWKSDGKHVCATEVFLSNLFALDALCFFSILLFFVSCFGISTKDILNCDLDID